MNEEVFAIKVNSELYSPEAILNASCKFTDLYYIKTDKTSETEVSVTFNAKDGSVIQKETINQFQNELIDQQIRINVGNEFKTIRELIVKKAFSPVTK